MDTFSTEIDGVLFPCNALCMNVNTGLLTLGYHARSNNSDQQSQAHSEGITHKHCTDVTRPHWASQRMWSQSFLIKLDWNIALDRVVKLLENMRLETQTHSGLLLVVTEMSWISEYCGTMKRAGECVFFFF